jgi:hypothetical protein
MGGPETEPAVSESCARARERETEGRMDSDTPNGTERSIAGRSRVFYDGYWIKAYPVPADTLLEKRRLIAGLTRRLFNHVEHGLNVPGERLDEARQAYDGESDPDRRRVKGGMLAGALFNRAADIFQKLVELQRLGVVVKSDNPLMRDCGRHLSEALELGKIVRHRSGDEGIDELWGEPFKAFAFPIEEFYKSRYVKIALTMRAIDRIASELSSTFASMPALAGVVPLVDEFVRAAKTKTETLRTDGDVFETWTTFVVSGERLLACAAAAKSSPPFDDELVQTGRALIERARDLIADMARARVPMPKSTLDLGDALAGYRAEVAAAAATRRAAFGAESGSPRPSAPPAPGRG